MILEEATFEAYEYYPRDLPLKSGKLVLAVCERCGDFKLIRKNAYYTFCSACSHILGEKSKGNQYALGYKHTDDAKLRISKNMMSKKNSLRVVPNEETRCKLSAVHKGKSLSEEHKAKIGAANKGRVVTKEQRAKQSATIKGKTDYNPQIESTCLQCKKTFPMTPKEIKRGRGKYCSKECANKAKFKCGRKISYRRHTAKRKRQLGYTLLLPLKEGEVGHHVTNEYVVGIPAEVHHKFSGYSREKHRALVLEWLKGNDKKKYNIVLEVLK